MKLKSFVISLQRRSDRLKNFNQLNKHKTTLDIELFTGVNGCQLTCTNELLKLFENNDFNMRSGVVGCALSHIQLYIDLVYSEYDSFLIFEDDAILTSDFDAKLKYVLRKNKDFDILYLGHHPKKFVPETHLKHILSDAIRYDTSTSFEKSIGGLFSYIITNKAARKILEYINLNGLKSGIDTFLQIRSDNLKCLYCSPFISYSLCYRPGKDVDSDIQYNYSPIKNIDEHCIIFNTTGRITHNGRYSLEKCINYL